MHRALSKVCCFVIVCLLTACNSDASNQMQKVENAPPASPQAENKVLPTPELISPQTETDVPPRSQNNSPIRKVDFSNFTFPWTESFTSDDEKTFTLKDGEKKRQNEECIGASLSRISYGDLTNDVEDEAVVTIYEDGGGNGTATMVFVYTMDRKKPKLLQSFEFDWGSLVRNAFAEGGQLVIENYQICEGGDACCCPSFYWISRYQLKSGKFMLLGEPQKISLKATSKNTATDNP